MFVYAIQPVVNPVCQPVSQQVVSCKRGLVNSRTGKWQSGQLAVSQMPPKERKLSTQSRRWHPRVVQSASCPVSTCANLCPFVM